METKKRSAYEGIIRPHNEEDVRLMVAHLHQFFEIAGMRNEQIGIKIWFELPKVEATPSA